MWGFVVLDFKSMDLDMLREYVKLCRSVSRPPAWCRVVVAEIRARGRRLGLGSATNRPFTSLDDPRLGEALEDAINYLLSLAEEKGYVAIPLSYLPDIYISYRDGVYSMLVVEEEGDWYRERMLLSTNSRESVKEALQSIIIRPINSIVYYASMLRSGDISVEDYVEEHPYLLALSPKAREKGRGGKIKKPKRQLARK